MIQDIRFALRTLARQKGFAAIAIAALALGIGANTAVFTVLNGVLLRPLPFPDASRLTLVSFRWMGGPFQFGPSMVDRDYVSFEKSNRAFEHLAMFNGGDMTLTGAGDPARLKTTRVTANFLATLGVNPAIGRAIAPEEDRPGGESVVMLSDRIWRSRFGASRETVGSRILLDGVPHTVIAVMPAGFAFPADSEVWVPLALNFNSHNSLASSVIGRLKPDVTREQALADLTAFTQSVRPPSKKERALAEVLPLKELLVGDARKSLEIFSWAVLFVLLIACANVANLLLIRAVRRRQEIAVRSALGAGRWRVMRQLLTESVLLSLAGGAAGLLVATWGVPLLLSLAPKGSIPRTAEIRVDAVVFAFAFGISLVTGIVFGLAPALQAVCRDQLTGLSQGGRTSSRRGGGLRHILVISELSLALVLLSGAGWMAKSFWQMRSTNPGFRTGNLMTMTVDLPSSVYRTAEQMREFHARTLEKLAALPGAQSAVAVNWRPLGRVLISGNFNMSGGRKMPQGFIVAKPAVNAGYFAAMGIPLLAGREFDARDGAGAPLAAVVSESVAKELWPGGPQAALGQQITMDDNPTPQSPWMTVVGVVGEVLQRDLRDRPMAALYQPYTQLESKYFLDHMTFGVRTAAAPGDSLSASMRDVLREVDRDQPVQSLATMDDLIALTTAEPLFQTRLLMAFAIIALALAAIGTYGVLAYSVSERTHEIGIRMALGARISDVRNMVLSRVMMLAATGVVFGAVAALAATRALARFVFTRAGDAGTFLAASLTLRDNATLLAVAAILAAVALAAGWIPARRASRVDPLVALRHE